LQFFCNALPAEIADSVVDNWGNLLQNCITSVQFFVVVSPKILFVEAVLCPLICCAWR